MRKRSHPWVCGLKTQRSKIFHSFISIHFTSVDFYIPFIIHYYRYAAIGILHFESVVKLKSSKSFFAFDSSQCLKNSAGLISDLEKRFTPEVDIKVIISSA